MGAKDLYCVGAGANPGRLEIGINLRRDHHLGLRPAAARVLAPPGHPTFGRADVIPDDAILDVDGVRGVALCLVGRSAGAVRPLEPSSMILRLSSTYLSRCQLVGTARTIESAAGR